MNLHLLKLLQVALFLTLLIIYHINAVMTQISIERMNWNQLLLKLSTQKSIIIVVVIYRHPSIDLTDLNSNYLTIRKYL